MGVPRCLFLYIDTFSAGEVVIPLTQIILRSVKKVIYMMRTDAAIRRSSRIAMSALNIKTLIGRVVRPGLALILIPISSTAQLSAS